MSRVLPVYSLSHLGGSLGVHAFTKLKALGHRRCCPQKPAESPRNPGKPAETLRNTEVSDS